MRKEQNPDTRLKWWMRIIGGFYLLLGVINTPPLMAARMSVQYPFLELGLEHLTVKAILDLWFVFGAESAVLGFMLLVASAAPLHNKILVQMVLLLELVRIILDLFWIGRGYYGVAPYTIWIVFHAAIILSGWRLLRQAETSSDRHGTESLLQPG